MKCKKCGFENLENARFCSGCGIKLSDGTTEEVPRNVPSMPDELTKKVQSGAKQLKGSRRNVAVIFADVSGFTAMSEELDPEEVTERMNMIFQGLSDVIYNYEGYIDKFIGDCVMILFGAPVTHEDDPLRAVLCAIDLMKVMTEFEDLELSIGINYGKVMAGGVGSDQKMDYTVMGDTVNLAQRLESAAGRGEIFVSEKIYNETRAEIKYKVLKPIKVKGKKKPVTPYRPVSVKSRYLTRRITEIPLFGREEELKKLIRIFNNVNSGKGQVVSIVGEAGIGKSKLIYEFKSEILRKKSKGKKKDIKILEGRGIDYLKDSDYWTVKQILRKLIGFSETDSKEEVTKKIDTYIKSLKDKSIISISPLIKFIFSAELSEKEKLRVEKMKAEDRYYILNRLLILLFKRISMTYPLVLVFEDLHWSDNATLEFCRKLAQQIEQTKILILLLFRPGFEFEEFLKLKNYHQLNLSCLTEEDGLDLIKYILKSDKIDLSLKKLVLERSEGNPFYIEELSSLLLNGDMILIEKNLAKLKGGDIDTIPLKLNELILSKVDKLDLDLKHILEIASVIGSEFTINIIENLIEYGAKLRTGLKMIEKKDLIRKITENIINVVSEAEDDYMFKHIIIKDSVYESILKTERTWYHKHIGEIVEKLSLNNLDNYLEILIYHFRLGKEKEKVLKYLQIFAEKADDSGNYSKAELLYEEWVEIAGDMIFDSEIGINNYIQLINIKNTLAKYDEGFKIVTELETKAKNLLKGELLLRFLLQKSLLLESKGEYKKAKSIKKKVEALLNSIKIIDKKLIGRSYHAIGALYREIGDYNQALEYFQKAIKNRIKFFGPEHCEVSNSYLGLGNVYYDKGYFKNALKYFQKALEIDLKVFGSSHPFIGKTYMNIGIVYDDKGDYDKALTFQNKALNIKLKVFGPEHPEVAANYNNIGIIYSEKGDYDQALMFHRKSLDIKLKVFNKDHPDLAFSYSNLGEVHSFKREYDKALKYFQKSLKINLKVFGSEHPYVGVDYINIGDTYLYIESYNNALKNYQKAYEINLKALGSEHHYISYSYQGFGSAYLKIGKPDKALEFFEKALKIRLKILGKEHVETARTQFGMAQALNTLNKKKEALKYLTQSIKVGRKHKASWLKNAEELLKRI
ncbi:tetratricopeptide repeat protein [Candidatus Dependentiae bacterium]|nr:tetratricopeptide repeat protein [Candidatus Dependentiae bacterium]